MAEIELLFEKKELIKILEKIPNLIEFQKIYQDVKYLVNLEDAENNELFLYDIYQPIMKIVATSSQPFTDFTQANYDSLTRMKWKWLST